MQSLSPGAKPGLLLKLEQKLGFPMPPGLRALWLLHDGQRRAHDSLIGALHLLPISWVVNERPATLAALARTRAEAENPSGMTRDEARSDHWFPIARSDAGQVIVNSRSGRVFSSENPTSALQRIGASVPHWLETYVSEVERGDYELVVDASGSFFARVDPEFNHPP